MRAAAWHGEGRGLGAANPALAAFAGAVVVLAVLGCAASAVGAARVITVPSQPSPAPPRFTNAASAVGFAGWPLDRAGLLESGPPTHRSSGTRRIGGEVGASLYRAARAAGLGAPEAQRLLEGVTPRLGVELAPSDRFAVVLAGASIRSATIVAANGETRLALPRWDANRPVDPAPASIPAPAPLAGWAAPAARLLVPVAGRLTSGFGMRVHPILGFSRMHAGIDLAAPSGTPVVAASDGVVAYAGWRGGYGNFVRIDQGGGAGSGYGHLGRILVAPGRRVRAGEVIGAVGATGLATGPHLHFEVYRGGRAVDPLARF